MNLALIVDQARLLGEARAHAVLLARAATDLPGIGASLDPEGIRLTARHLHARLFGTRHRPRDARLALFGRAR